MDVRNLLRVLLLAALAVCALISGGCAGLRVPRIDPSGERIFVWPQDQVPAPVPASANLQAPPVYTDAVFPPATANPAVVPGTVGGQPIAGLVPPIPQDRLSITPDRVLAPVGSEVILKAGLCTRENFLLTDSKIEWLLASDGAGEFVSLGGRGWFRDPLLPWNKPKKIDNHFATGYTAKVPLQITRGTADPTDDVEVQPGEAWATVTSPVEGVSRLTAVAPEIETWANRRATATIYWIDVQWEFPQPVISATGAQVLTTTVRRHTDGTPIEGWLVRYEVANGALTGGNTDQAVEVPTDAEGRASIDVTPTGSAGAVTTINMQLVRPANYAGSTMPRLVIANGASTINWTDGESEYVPPPDDLGPPDLNFDTQPPPTTTLRGPALELEVSPEFQQYEVGREASFIVEIRNSGDTTATGIILRDEFDVGLTHLKATAGENKIETLPGTIPDIGPNQSYSLPMTLGVQKAGQLCQNFTVTCAQGPTAQRRACIQGTQPARQPQGALDINASAPRLQNVGETALFTFSINNTGDAPLTNLVIEYSFDRELQPQTPSGAELRGNTLFWQIPRLDVNNPLRFDVNCNCLAPKSRACGNISVIAETGTVAGSISKSEVSCIEIRPQTTDVIPPESPLGSGGVTPDVLPNTNSGSEGANSGPLRMEVTLPGDHVRAGTRTTIFVAISNRGTASDRQVRLALSLPAEMSPDLAAIKTDANVQPRFNNGILEFDPINELRVGEQLQFAIPCNALRQGLRNIKAQLSSQNLPQPLQQMIDIEITPTNP